MMFFDFTVYPPSGAKPPSVGFYLYDKQDPATRQKLCGDPSVTLKHFHEIVTGTYQYNDFWTACEKVGISLRDYL